MVMTDQDPTPLGEQLRPFLDGVSQALTRRELDERCRRCGRPRGEHSAPRGERCPSRFGKGWGPGTFLPHEPEPEQQVWWEDRES